MHIQFDFWDFTKSAWSLAAGSFAVFLLGLLRSPVETSTLILTLGITLGVLAVWGLFAVKYFMQSRNLTFFDQEEIEAPPPDGLPQQQIAFPYASSDVIPSYEPVSLRLRPLKARAPGFESALAQDL